MVARQETPFQTTSTLHAGEFNRGRSYKNWRPRGSGDWLLIYTVSGAGRIATPAGAFTLPAGEAILFAPADYQDYSTDPMTGRWRLRWSHFKPKPGWHPWLNWPRNTSGVSQLHLPRGEVRGAFARALLRTIRVLRRRFPNAGEFAANGLEEALLWARLATPRGEWMRLDPRVRRAMDYLAENLRRPFELESLARHCGLSVSRLAHLFKSETRLSPQRFFEQQRMQQAGQLLRVTGLGIAEIAAEVGYDDPFYFTNRFRRHTGKSPSAFRRQNR